MGSFFTNATRLVWSRTVDAAHVGMFISSQASSTSATVIAALRDGGTTVSSAATRCAARLLPCTVRLTWRGVPRSSLPTKTRTSHTPGVR